ncbi:hypothetical protein SAMN05444411_103226 [Lutibacter oricola]|uniref:MetA-pathway of phenol degradation n=1 Tax=Lutibacter oricola TaxID=762486 RepID=A0A1H2ZEJ9_9FLAO|nr:hypothetical protein [Lutibacter oricola]SDX15796.1 hypothetical protein SAMN05444411_103226 [Lutibacter oricola]
MKKLLFAVLITAFTLNTYAQETTTKSNIQEYTPSKLLDKGQIDIKWFNNLYTQTKSTFTNSTEPRETFFTSSLDIFTGVSENSKLNIGLLLEFRSNVIGGRDAFDVFKFDGERNSARSGITSFAPAIKFNPIKNVGNFTIQSAFHIPLVDNESENGVFLDQKGFILQNRFFYDYTFPGNKWQIFTELNTEFNFGKSDDSFANNSLGLTPGVFLSYFPSNKFTLLVLAQHNQRLDLGNEFTQNYTALGGGAKYQLSTILNIEALYTNFVDGSNTGLGQTYNIGLRWLFN